MKTIYNKPIKEIIKERHSVRNYTNKPLSKDCITQINDYIRTVKNPFDKKVQIKLITKSSQTKDIKLGTYGFVNGANYFLVTSCDDDEAALTALGYSLEQVILYCTSIGLGTVWLGGSFSKSYFAKEIGLAVDQILPIVAPVGYEGGKKPLMARVIGHNTSKRKDFSELFFENTFNVPLTPEHAGDFEQPLDMLRLAPSGINVQPWRVLKIDDTVHFFLSSKKGLTRVDMGIGLCHFDLTAKEMAMEGTFFVQDNIDSKNKDYSYVVSWRKTNH